MRENSDGQTVFEIDLRKLLLSIASKWWLLVICALICAGAARIFTACFVTPMYQAEVSIYVNNMKETQQIENVNSGSLDASQRLVATYIQIGKSDRVLGQVAASLGDYTAAQLRDILVASKVGSTEIFQLVITHPDPKEAVRVANTMAEIVPGAIADIIEGSSARVIDYASEPTEPSSPNIPRTVTIGAVIGLVIACAYLILTFMLDTRIKEPEDLTELFDIPILGQIPDFTKNGSSQKKDYTQGYADTHQAQVNQTKEGGAAK